MLGTACVTHEFDPAQHVLISRVTGLVSLDRMVEIVASAAHWRIEHGAVGYILDLTGACTCLEKADVPIFVARTVHILGRLPVAGVDPHNHERSMQAEALAVRRGAPAMACLTVSEARLFIDYATGQTTARAMQLNHLIRVASSLPAEKLEGLIDAVQSLLKPA